MEKIKVTLSTDFTGMEEGQYFDILLDGERAVFLRDNYDFYFVHNCSRLDGYRDGRYYWNAHRDSWMPTFRYSWFKDFDCGNTVGDLLSGLEGRANGRIDNVRLYYESPYDMACSVIEALKEGVCERMARYLDMLRRRVTDGNAEAVINIAKAAVDNWKSKSLPKVQQSAFYLR